MKNIIFDLGGVLLDIDFKLSDKAFAEAGIPHFDQYISQHYADDLFERFETDAISVPDFYDEFREKAHTSISNDRIKEAWNAMLLHFSKDRMQLLEQIGQKYNIYLFSNTNEIHVNYFTDLCLSEIGRPLKSYFIKTWYSNEVGVRKPYPASFRKLLQTEGLLPEETLFLDDTIENINGAELAGLRAILIDSPKDQLQQLLN